MQTTLRLDDALYREAKAQAAREGITLSHFIEDALALRVRIGRQETIDPLAATKEHRRQAANAQRNELMNALLERTAHFRIGIKPTREEMHERQDRAFR